MGRRSARALGEPHNKLEEQPMSQAKYTSKSARSRKTLSGKTLSVLGLAGVSLAATAATTNKWMRAGMPSPATAPVQAFTMGEEEMSDVTLATFHLFDKESVNQSRSMLQLTRCGGCGRCGGGCRGCGGGCENWRMRMSRMWMSRMSDIERMRMPRLRLRRRVRWVQLVLSASVHAATGVCQQRLLKNASAEMGIEMIPFV